MYEPFTPALLTRSPHLQTIFGSLRMRVAGKNEMADVAEETIVSTGNGGRLLGYYSRQNHRPPKALIILIHGWEGSADSTYMLSTGRYFYRKGYDIFRLNLWDHGKSHHLNRGLFHGAMTEETAGAVASVARLLPDRHCYLIGFSLGGNFALRIALRQSIAPISNLKNTFCVSPALDPYKTTLAIDAGPFIYRHYFLAKWKWSLKQKQRCFPELYNFDSVLHHRTCMALTEAIMPWYTEFGDYRDYFRRYAMTGNTLLPLSTPVTIFTAADDPVVCAEDFHLLPRNRYLDLSIQRYGGHCGFLDPFPFGCWYEKCISETLAGEAVE